MGVMIDLNALALPALLNELVSRKRIDELLAAAFAEDVPDGRFDLTTRSIIDAGATGNAHIIARHHGVIAGLAIIATHFAEDVMSLNVSDGQGVSAGQELGSIECDIQTILRVERPFLNILAWLSGIATLTRHYVDAVSQTRAVICDTRKTTPGLRAFEKYAVRCGGGTLHRLGLYDAALYKDNHLAGIETRELASKLSRAVRDLRRKNPVRFIEVEVDTLEQLQQVLTIEPGLIDIVLLDNMTIDQLRQAVAMRQILAPRILLEASGGVNLQTVQAIANTGVDRISVGAITHSAPWLDVGLDIKP